MFANFLEKRRFAQLHKTKFNKLFKVYKIENKLIRNVFRRKLSKLQKNNPKNLHKKFFNTIILQLDAIEHINLAKGVNSVHKDLLKNKENRFLSSNSLITLSSSGASKVL